MADHEHDERTSLVRSNSALNRVNSPPHNYNNGYNTGNGHYHNNNNNNNNNNHGDFARRNPRTLLAQVQRGLAPFQAWAAKTLHAGEESSAVNWVQNARVARTFMMIINTIIAVLAFVLMGVEVVEMVLREPLLDYLLPESEITLLAAGATIVACTFGFAVAYNLLVEEDTTDRGEGNNNEGHRGNGSGGNGGDLGPRNPTPPNSDNIFGQNNDPQQQTRRPRLMFTKASTYLLNGNAVFLAVILVTFIIAIAQRSVHLSQMDKELNSVWTDAIRHRTKLISEFEIHHECCGFNHITDRPFPPVINKPEPNDTRPLTCNENPLYGYKVPCKAELTNNFERWQRGIQRLLLVQVTMLVPLFLLVVVLSGIGFLKLKARKQEGLEDAKAQVEATAAVPVADGRGGAQHERALLEDVNSHNGGTSLLIGVDAEPATLTRDRPVVQPSLI